jgi:hypothetical protein
MNYGQGRGGTMNYGQRRGFGFRGTSPGWPYIGRGRGGLPRCARYIGPGETSKPVTYPDTARYDTTDDIRRQIEVLQAQLNDIEIRIPDVENERKSD